MFAHGAKRNYCSGDAGPRLKKDRTEGAPPPFVAGWTQSSHSPTPGGNGTDFKDSD